MAWDEPRGSEYWGRLGRATPLRGRVERYGLKGAAHSAWRTWRIRWAAHVRPFNPRLTAAEALASPFFWEGDAPLPPPPAGAPLAEVFPRCCAARAGGSVGGGKADGDARGRRGGRVRRRGHGGGDGAALRRGRPAARRRRLSVGGGGAEGGR